MSNPTRRARPKLVEYVDGIHTPVTRASDDPKLALASLNRAMNMIVVVRDEGADSVAAILDPLDRQELYGLIAVLAALAPDDVSHHQLLSWLTHPDEATAPGAGPAVEEVTPEMRAAHAAFNAGHRTPEIRELESAYQRIQRRRLRARRAATARTHTTTRTATTTPEEGAA